MGIEEKWHDAVRCAAFNRMEMASRKLEIARGKHVLESVFDGEDFDPVVHDAVVYPPAAVLAEHLPVLRTSYAGECLYAKLWICR